MENSAEQGKSPRNLVDMFAAENKQEQKTTMDRKIKKKRFTPGKLAVSYQALKAAMANPVMTIRNQ